ncbi:hypothetical protein [Nitrosopumilus sp.]|nr:hypothetical protein [Nitrosopumilus sp.]MCV0410512.1 hypothetical protein [Nitrosopumilus sp.]
MLVITFKVIEMIDYEKYLKCPDCRNAGLYCKPHREEVETILKNND